MANKAALRRERSELVDRMRAMLKRAEHEDRDFTEEECADYDRMKFRVETINRELEQLDLEAHLSAPRPAIAAAVDNDRARYYPRGDWGRQEFESLGEFLSAVRFNPDDARLSNLYHEFETRGASDQAMGTGSRGGFAVPTQFRAELLSVSPQQAIFRPRANVLPAGEPPDAAISIPALDQDNGQTDTAKTYGGVEVAWLEEGGTKPQTDVKLREITLEPHEVAGHIVVTDKLLRNWQASGTVIAGLLRSALVAAEEHAFMNGNGVGRPLGLINSDAAYVLNREQAGNFTFNDAQDMMARLLMRGGSPVWIVSQSVLPKLTSMRNLAGTSPEIGDGSLVWNPNARNGVVGGTLLGYPVVIHERSPSLGNKGDVVLADLSHYLIKDGSGPFVAASEHVYFTQNKTIIKAFWNVDGRPWLTGPLTLENGYQVSPFVVLDVPEAA